MKQKGLIIFLSTSVVICIGVIAYLVFFKDILNADYNKSKKDKNIVLVDDSNDKMDKSEGGGAVSLSYTKDVVVDSSKRKVSMYFKNPGKSTQSLVIELIITKDGEDVVIASTDRIPAGYQITEMDLKENVEIKKGSYEGKFNVMYYDEETDEKAIVNTNIPLTITVK